MNSMKLHPGLIFLLTGLFCTSIQLVSAQANNSNATNAIKVPSHLDIESQSTQQEMTAINNSASNSTNATEQASNVTNITNNSNQSLQEFTNRNMNG